MGSEAPERLSSTYAQHRGWSVDRDQAAHGQGLAWQRVSSSRRAEAKSFLLPSLIVPRRAPLFKNSTRFDILRNRSLTRILAPGICGPTLPPGAGLPPPPPCLCGVKLFRRLAYFRDPAAAPGILGATLSPGAGPPPPPPCLCGV